MNSFLPGYKADDNTWGVPNELKGYNSKLWNKLVPMSDNCSTLEGELLRAASKICYDYFNNGWGCNNWSGAVVFLRKFSKVPTNVLNHFKKYSHGEPVDGVTDYSDNDPHSAACFLLMKSILEQIKEMPGDTPNTRDLFDFQETSYVSYDDED